MSHLSANDASHELAIDAKAVASIKQLALKQPDQALKHSAKQFEALFINMMLQSMRKASFNSGLLQSHEKTLYTSMFDQQLSQTMANKGMGLADMMLKQLQTLYQNEPNTESNDLAGSPLSILANLNTSQTNMTGLNSKLKGFKELNIDQLLAEHALWSNNMSKQEGAGANAKEFCQQMTVHAQAAQQKTGIPATFILAQAALESGWGRRQIVGADGTNSHNLFGIKAGSDWKGNVTEVTTTEYMDGVPRKVVAKFRAYGSETEAFQDYASLLKNSPRYQSVIANADTAAGFANGLQQAGYATDPQYAQKLMQLIHKIESV